MSRLAAATRPTQVRFLPPSPILTLYATKYNIVCMKPEIVVGDGPESVYLYFYQNDKERALSKGADVWECKIGFSVGDYWSRICKQKTAMPRYPTVGLLIRTKHAASLESAIHVHLSDCKIDCPGDEWFLTSPGRVKEAVESIMKMVPLTTAREVGIVVRQTRVARGLSQSELAVLAKVRQATISKVESGGDVMLSILLDVINALGSSLEIKN